jgi:hypothetical protein
MCSVFQKKLKCSSTLGREVARVNVCGLFMALPEKNPVVLQSLRLINETYFHQKNPKKQNKYVWGPENLLH